MKKTYQNAFSMIELLLVMTVVAIIIVSATRYFSATTSSYQVTRTLEDIKSIRKAAAEWVLNQPDYSDISLATLSSAGLIPQNITASIYTVAVGSPTTRVNISAGQLSPGNCAAVGRALQNQAISWNCPAPVSGVTTITAIFG